MGAALHCQRCPGIVRASSADCVSASCGQLASALSISIASARRKVDLVAAKEGVRDNEGRLLIAQRLLVEAQGVGEESRQLLDVLLEAVKEEEMYLGDD